MNDDRIKYGTDFTSVKVHQSPGGNSTLNLGWEEPARRRGGNRDRVPEQQSAPRGQSWDNPPAPAERQPPQRNPPRGYQEQRGGYQDPAPYRAYQDPEPAYRDDMPWRGGADPAQQRGYDAEDSRAQRYPDPRGDYPREQGRYRAEEYQQAPVRPRVDRPDLRQLQGYSNARPQQYQEPQYDQRPQYQQPQQDSRRYQQPQGYPQETSNVHTSVKVREPPGGRSNFTFG